MPEKSSELQKTLRPIDAVMIVVGNVIGVGIFTTTGFIAGDLPDARMIMAVWALGGNAHPVRSTYLRRARGHVSKGRGRLYLS